jgi:hypothetical protein
MYDKNNKKGSIKAINMSQTRVSTNDFLASIDPSYVVRYGAVFENLGFEYTDDIMSELYGDDNMMPQLREELAEAGAREVQLRKIVRAIDNLSVQQQSTQIITITHVQETETSMDANLKVLRTWLDECREAKRVDIENINNKVQEHTKRRVINGIRGHYSLIISSHKAYEELSQREKDRMKSRAERGADYHPNKYRNVDFVELEKMLASVEYDQYNILTEKLSIIKQICEKGTKPQPKPTKEQVMEAHIEATYNMFNIINKRIDDIETKSRVTSKAGW